ncbi:uncharacterized protein LOC131664465 isoform X2 [Phymastichus coffea]|uniref:uncharacterized protein LOC131664465 isoform X2 n=1 Tax=Phymastichus coffea TaxID=108790 RepID=UPI00273B7AC0|nr:uncharacterized protein LOC131664465 isoform X2 [Phymastichus coffea]
MVMAGSEGVPGSGTDEPLSSRLQWLRQRREALQEKLSQKNNELKSLCIEEAELTGVLPPEIPLEPGESIPNFRKRLATSINYPQNAINKLKSSGAEESALELERQVQINIAEAALAKLNDLSESKAVRRKHRSLYQQSQRRLQELNAQLNFIRQSYGSGLRQSTHIPLHSSQSHLQGNARHRTKKPRPPLETAGKDLSPKIESRNFLEEGGISLSPLGSQHNFNYPSYDFQDLGNHGYPPGSSNISNQNRATFSRPTPSPVEHRRSNADLNANNNIYVPPEHFRNRAYSQGGNSSKSVSPQLQFPPERPYRPVPNTYTEEERMQIRQMKLKRQNNDDITRSPQYTDSMYMENEVHRRSAQMSHAEADFVVPRYDGRIPEYGHYHLDKSQNPTPVLRPRENLDNKPPVETYVPPGHWMRLDDEIVWCTDEQTSTIVADKFGSLDRRKHHTLHHPPNPEIQSRYHTVAISGKNALIPHARPYPTQPSMHSPDTNNLPSSNRILLRTQSLGSVETWPQQPNSPTDSEGHESVDRPPKPKPKEWYETALDTGGGGGGPLPPRAVRRTSQHNPLPVKERAAPVRSNSIPSNRRLREAPPPPPQQVDEQLPPPVPRFEGRVLEIPAESKPLPGSQENGNEPIIPLNSPTNHTVVQPGKYQPYREVTKPFEMSDFYKYSTKYRKRAESNEQQQQQ